MPTDPNNLTDGQRVAVLGSTTHPEMSSGDIVAVKFDGCGLVSIRRTDIITDWPPEPSADDAEWVKIEHSTHVNLGSYRIGAEIEPGFEYEVLRRPITPKWVPTVGKKAMWDGVHVNVTATDGGRAVIMREYVVDVDSLTQPKEQPHDQD